MKNNPSIAPVRLRPGAVRDGEVTINIEGRLDSNTTGKIWRQATETVTNAKARSVIIDASQVDYCDGSGIALFVHLRALQHKIGGQLEITGLRPEFQVLLEESELGDLEQWESRGRPKTNLAEDVGRAVVGFWEDTQRLIIFIGELVSGLGRAAIDPKSVRWRDVVLVAETAGVNALPIVTLVSFLMGVIMAFQGAISLRRFGADVFVANLVGLAMLRELGPLMTAIILAGRSGSAFAAELGTMKVREEIDALKTMGLDPVRFLVVTRVIAAVVMTPLLTVFADLLGLIGGAVVMRSFGIPVVTFYHQVQYQVTYGSLVGGLVKSFVFGILVAAIGCVRGLQTTTGASAVGESTTRAVVSGIILIVVTDGIFSVVYYYLNV
jgi:phospholipid/cholesterol/gamma-HCH transport system permease protein